VPEPKTVKNRVHLDLISDTFDAETERLLSLGAHQAVVGDRAVLRPIYTEPVIASVALTEQQARQQHGEDVATGLFPWIANARAVMQDEHAGWSRRSTRPGPAGCSAWSWSDRT